MTVVAAYLYRNGKRVREARSTRRSSAPATSPSSSGSASPTRRPRSCGALQQQYDLHPLAIEDALKADQLPKVDVYGDQLFVVARTAHLEEGDRLWRDGDVRRAQPHHQRPPRLGAAHTALRDQLEAAPSLLMHGVDYVLHAILDFVVDGYLPLVEAIEEEVLAMEHARSTISSAGRRSTASSPCAAS